MNTNPTQPHGSLCCMWSRVLLESPVTRGTRTRILCSPLDVSDILNIRGNCRYAPESKLIFVLGRSSTLLYPAFLRSGTPFLIASSPVHSEFQTCQCVSKPHALYSVSTREPPIFPIRLLHTRIDLVAVAQLILPVS